MSCCSSCGQTIVVNVPGTAGAAGASGAAGSDGVNAFTTLTSNLAIPGTVNSTVTAQVVKSSWMAVGQKIFVGDGTNQGTFSVNSAPASPFTSVSLKWLGYAGDSAASTTINSGAIVTPAGQSITTSLLGVTEILNGTILFTPNSATTKLYVECIGGGASGGGVATAATNAGAGGGGGGGAYSAVLLTSLKASYAVAVGAGGTAPTAGANAGNAGGDTTFDSPSVCTAKGGTGGGADTVAVGPRVAGASGSGGASSSGVGDVKLDGTAGGYGLALAAAQAVSGNGGVGPLGGNAKGVIAQGTGNAGGQYGAGGSGGCILSGGASVSAGAGANGLVRIWQFA